MATSPKEENKKDEPRETTAENGVQYTGDGTVVGANDRVSGEESLAPPPAPFIQYGGPTEQSGDGFRRPGAFRAKYGLQSAFFSNLTAIPYTRVG